MWKLTLGYGRFLGPSIISSTFMKVISDEKIALIFKGPIRM